jgi:hypothetical protein
LFMPDSRLLRASVSKAMIFGIPESLRWARG